MIPTAFFNHLSKRIDGFFSFMHNNNFNSLPSFVTFVNTFLHLIQTLPKYKLTYLDAVYHIIIEFTMCQELFLIFLNFIIPYQFFVVKLLLLYFTMIYHQSYTLQKTSFYTTSSLHYTTAKTNSANTSNKP